MHPERANMDNVYLVKVGVTFEGDDGVEDTITTVFDCGTGGVPIVQATLAGARWAQAHGVRAGVMEVGQYHPAKLGGRGELHTGSVWHVSKEFDLEMVDGTLDAFLRQPTLGEVV